MSTELNSDLRPCVRYEKSTARFNLGSKVRLRSSLEIRDRRRHAHCVDAPVTDFESVTTESFTQLTTECSSSWSSRLVIDETSVSDEAFGVVARSPLQVQPPVGDIKPGVSGFRHRSSFGQRIDLIRLIRQAGLKSNFEFLRKTGIIKEEFL